MHITPFEIATAAVSAALCIGGIVAIPWLIRRLPPDYFVRPRPKRSVAKMVARNVLGGLLIIAGIAMLILPGPGIIGVLFGVTILDLPIKQRILKWLLRNAKIQESLQRLRSKRGKQPFAIPST